MRTACAALLALVLLAHLCAHAQTLTTRWEQLERAAEQRWRTALDDAPAPRSLGAALSAWALYDELRARLDDPADALASLESYRPVLSLDGVPRQLYNRAENLFWQRDYIRAQRLFGFLLLPGNPDGFTIGSSHYWFGFLLSHFARNPQGALPHFLAAHRYPACLVYIDAAGREAAELYLQRGKPDIACALLAQQIPSFVFWENEHIRAARAFEIARARADVTNIVRNLLRMQAAAAHLPHLAADIAARRSWVDGFLPHQRYDAIATHLATHEPWGVYQAEIISRALAGPDQGARDAALADCLLHDWPTLDAVAELHPEILTSRPASNNVFEQVRRTMLNPQQP